MVGSPLGDDESEGPKVGLLEGDVEILGARLARMVGLDDSLGCSLGVVDGMPLIDGF